jgi:iron-sulfur cluster repair protein YtfE (RIC family)
MDALSMLEHDHRHVESMLKTLSSAEPGADRAAMVAELTKALELHMRFEEEHLYPLVQELDAEMEEEAEVEHRLAREGLAKVNEMLEMPGFAAAVDMLMAGISHHVKDEEKEAFPTLRQQCDPARLTSLGSTLLEEKRRAGMLVDSQSTKAEMQEIATELGIERSSSMSKEELKEKIGALA